MRDAIERGSRDDYWRWLAHVMHAGECTRPIRLTGQVSTVDAGTGEIVRQAHTNDMPDQAIYTACGNRRASVCPACSAVYRADTYQLVKAGLAGGKGVPESVAAHPVVFLTLTAPSFGPVHSQRTDPKTGKPRVCRPGRGPRCCRHGIDHRCRRVHADGDRLLGQPLCLDCYDHAGQAVWNAMAGELWRRTIDHAGKQLRRAGARASYAKVAEMQARGVVHFHALIRLDSLHRTPEGSPLPPPRHLGPEALRAVLLEAASHTTFTTPGHADRPEGWVIAWGEQIDARTVRAGTVTDLTETAVAAYLAKYATKGTEATGHTSTRLTAATIGAHADPATHAGRLIGACWRLGRPGAQLEQDAPARIGYQRLRRWAHMLGFGGHFSTKSRRYSTTLTQLRRARTQWRRNRATGPQTPAEAPRLDDDLDGEETTLLIGSLTYAGTGWHTTADAILASTAAAKAREQRRTGREETRHTTQQPAARAAA